MNLQRPLRSPATLLFVAIFFVPPLRLWAQVVVADYQGDLPRQLLTASAPAAGWQEYADSQQRLRFKLPADWERQNTRGPALLEIHSPAEQGHAVVAVQSVKLAGKPGAPAPMLDAIAALLKAQTADVDFRVTDAAALLVGSATGVLWGGVSRRDGAEFQEVYVGAAWPDQALILSYALPAAEYKTHQETILRSLASLRLQGPPVTAVPRPAPAVAGTGPTPKLGKTADPFYERLPRSGLPYGPGWQEVYDLQRRVSMRVPSDLQIFPGSTSILFIGTRPPSPQQEPLVVAAVAWALPPGFNPTYTQEELQQLTYGVQLAMSPRRPRLTHAAYLNVGGRKAAFFAGLAQANSGEDARFASLCYFVRGTCYQVVYICPNRSYAQEVDKLVPSLASFKVLQP